MDLLTMLIPVAIVMMVVMSILKALDVLVEIRTNHLRARGIGPAKRQWDKGWSPMVIPYLAFIYSDDHKAFSDGVITKAVMAQRILFPLVGLFFIGWFVSISIMMMR